MMKFNERYKVCPKCECNEQWDIQHRGDRLISTGEDTTFNMTFTCLCCGFSFDTYPADYKDNTNKTTTDKGGDYDESEL